ncbi:MAG TPA: hypothetical protein DDZ67_07615 [Xanthomonadaceae bacterium]|nr:hypothetical protein [Xanthomonadaceae bacterium]
MPASGDHDHSMQTDHARQQRQRILDAARECFIEDGFEAASMARIAARAGLSTGLSYHYFENKRAVVLALIRQQLEESRAGLARIQPSDDFVGTLESTFELWCSRMHYSFHAGLLSEITALGTRDPHVARDLQRNSRDVRLLVADWVRKRDAGHGRRRSAEELELAAALIQAVADGLLQLAAREPDFDRKLLRKLLERVLPLATG